MSHVGVIGLAVMGQNLALNLMDKGFRTSVYNRSEIRTKSMIETAKSQNLISALKPTYNLEEFVESLQPPKVIIIMVQSGTPVDKVLSQLKNLCKVEDIIVDGGNSNFEDTIRRCNDFSETFRFIGCGISGGEEGARFGPCIMPGGDIRAKETLMPILKRISAKSKDDSNPCTTWIGPGGAGHFVKMVHNGIEYADMQIISEVYWFMKHCLNMDNEAQSDIFANWDTSELSSYLINITADILKKKDAKSADYILDKVSDKAGQKGTGKWTVSNSLDFAVPVQAISEAVYARMISGYKSLRIKMQEVYENDKSSESHIDIKDCNKIISYLKDSLLASKIVAYSQGFSLIKKASDDYGWNINLGEVAKIFKGGCIIRSQFLDDIFNAYKNDPNLESLMLDKIYFKNLISSLDYGWRQIVMQAISAKIPMPAISSCLQYFDLLKSKNMASNLIQAQRDYFGAHGYEEVGKPGTFVHTEWTEYSGGATSGFYQK